MTRYPVRFDHADDNAIRNEMHRHRSVLESKHEGKHTIQCSCGASFAEEKPEATVMLFVEHFLSALKGSAA